jgi:hypothetical protein
MRVSRRLLAVALACLVKFCLVNFCLSGFCLSSLAAAQLSDQALAERVLGPQWKQLSRRAGMIFAGTVLAAPPQTATTQAATTQAVTAQTAPADRVASGTVDRVASGAVPTVELSFRVDEAIAGVEPGQVLTIHEWAGVWAMQFQRPMAKGQRILIFLYPPSRLGLTSPVGGSLGQIALDSTGKNVSKAAPMSAAAIGLPNASSPRPRASTNSVSVVQLERAIRSAREE